MALLTALAAISLAAAYGLLRSGYKLRS